MSSETAARTQRDNARNDDDANWSSGPAKEFSMSDRDFDQIRTVIRDMTGINMSDSKRRPAEGDRNRQFSGLPRFSQTRRPG